MGVCYGTPDFPTPSHTGYLRSRMMLTISSSSSSAKTNSHELVAGSSETFPEGLIWAEPNLIKFSFAELKDATKSFNKDTVVGEGGFGKVFKGLVLGKELPGTQKTIIAVKKLDRQGFQGYKEWQSEINFLGRLCHPNLINLMGYCQEDDELLLVYEFMAKGSLNNHLFGRGSAAHPLPWDIRLKIALGAAKGLAFLHNAEKKIIFRDFKTANILLDGSYTPKLTDFGLARFGPSGEESHVSTRVMGTYGYAAPEYIATGHLYLKSDVYSFGVVLLELLTGLTVFDKNRPQGKHNLVEFARPYLNRRRKLRTVMDSKLQGRYSIEEALQIANLAEKCLHSNHQERPSMTEVVEALEKVKAADRSPIDA